jgi:hypothetical protein
MIVNFEIIFIIPPVPVEEEEKTKKKMTEQGRKKKEMKEGQRGSCEGKKEGRSIDRSKGRTNMGSCYNGGELSGNESSNSYSSYNRGLNQAPRSSHPPHHHTAG